MCTYTCTQINQSHAHIHTHTYVVSALHICALTCRLLWCLCDAALLQAYKYLCQHIVLPFTPSLFTCPSLIPLHTSPLHSPSLSLFFLAFGSYLQHILSVQLKLIEMKLPTVVVIDTYLYRYKCAYIQIQIYMYLYICIETDER